MNSETQNQIHKSIALCDAVNSVIANLRMLEQSLLDTLDAVQMDDIPSANDPEYQPNEPKRRIERIPMPNDYQFVFEGGAKPLPHENLFNRLRIAIEDHYDGSVNAFANDIGFNQKTLWVWLSPDSPHMPQFKAVYKMCDILGWDFYDAIKPMGAV